MKYFLKPMLFIFVSMFVFTSCNNEDLFIEETLLADIEETPTDLEDSPNDSDTTVDSSMPCDFTLDSLQAGDTVIINCIMDLGAVTINLPANVTIVFDGGDIINGTLNFSNNSVISGELLNSSLNIMGSTPQLKDTIFNFDPNRWGIVEGVVADDIARNNRDLLTGYFEQLKGMGVNIFKIDQLDAYFKTDHESTSPLETAINVPSDFTVIMTNNTHLRVQPNNDVNTTLFALWKVNNVTIDGGILHGDRDTHDYSSGGTHEWGHCLRVGGSQNIVIKNMTMMDAGGDGIDIHSFLFTFKDDYLPSKNVLILNNKIIRSRRNGISITDGKDILVEGNEIIDTGIDTPKSKGTSPKWGIDIEPYQANGELYEIVEDITIRNNIEKGSDKGAFLIFRGDRIIIENNITECTISYGKATESIIRNNTLIAGTEEMRTTGTGISASYSDSNFGNKIYDNIVTNFSTGLRIKDSFAQVSDNTINDATVGLVIQTAMKDTNIFNNIIKSSKEPSDGVVNGSNTTLDNVYINDNSIDVTRNAIVLNKVNETVDYQFYLRNNTVINGATVIYLTNGINY